MQTEHTVPAREAALCYHCGAECVHTVKYDTQIFCCEGCRLVYDLLKENNLCTYYSISDQPGRPAETGKSKFEILDRPEIRSKILRFDSEDRARVIFRVDGMHCASCIWLLEHLPRIDHGVMNAEVNFPAREVTIDFDPGKTSLAGIAGVLSSMGYAPALNLADLDRPQRKTWDPRIIKIGVAGFCFGNIMMLSFPEYLGADAATQNGLLPFFGWLSLALSIPALVYCASGFFASAWKTLRFGVLNIDSPIALAIAITFGRSVYAVIHGNEAHYLDSMTGIIFFMLAGRYFQDRTFERLNFDRDYRSYFPVSVELQKDGKEVNIPVTDLKEGDKILIRSGELVPTDALLLSEYTHLDYSFVSGESKPVKLLQGQRIYAGARLAGGAARFQVISPVSSSYLTQLWNDDPVTRRNNQRRITYLDSISKWFSLALLLIAFGGATVWYFIEPARSLNVLTAVLIVACPCTLLLASTFTNGSVLRWSGRSSFFLKNADAIDRIATVDTIVFDKTGTITWSGSGVAEYQGAELTDDELNGVVLLARQSSHPMSRAIVSRCPGSGNGRLEEFSEHRGKGISGRVNGKWYMIGSAAFADVPRQTDSGSEVWIVIDQHVKGKFVIHGTYRAGVSDLVARLKTKYNVILLSGDNDAEYGKLQPIFGRDMHFGKSPAEKSDFIKKLKEDGKRVMMIGDGLNDSGALMEADAGIAVSDNTNSYFPACDAILDGAEFSRLDRLLSFTQSAARIVKMTFVISLLYNVAGMYFSLGAQLTPMVAAVLMPASSLTVILFTTLAVRISARQLLTAVRA